MDSPRLIDVYTAAAPYPARPGGGQSFICGTTRLRTSAPGRCVLVPRPGWIDVREGGWMVTLWMSLFGWPGFVRARSTITGDFGASRRPTGKARKGAHTYCMQPFSQSSRAGGIGVPKWVVIVERALNGAALGEWQYTLCCAATTESDWLCMCVVGNDYNIRSSALSVAGSRSEVWCPLRCPAIC